MFHHVTYEYQLLDRFENELGPLAGVERGSGRFTFSAAASIKSSAAITLWNTGQIENWLDVRIQPWVTVNDETWPLGVFIPDVPESFLDDMGATATVSLMDKLTILEGDYFGETFGATKNTVVTTAVRQIIESTGEPPGSITDDTAQLLTAIEWEPSDNKLKIVNDMLDAANFFSLWTDGRGRFQVTPWQAPARRGIRAEFVDGQNGVSLENVYGKGFTRRHDTGKIPNVVRAVSKADSDTEALVAEAINTNPDDPYSLPNRGYRKLPEGGPFLNVDTTSQSALNDFAHRRLIELSDVQETLVITHPPNKLRINDAVRFTSTRHNIEGRFTVQRQEWHAQFDATVSTTLRRVVDIDD